MKSKHHKEAQVWQRVLSPEPQEQQTLQMLIRQLWLDTAYLKHDAKNREDPSAGLLIREYAGQLQSLRGILRLTGGHLPRESGEPVNHSLSRCYDHALQRLAAYQLRSSDPVYGPVFRELAEQTQHHCFRITQLLGAGDSPGRNMAAQRLS